MNPVNKNSLLQEESISLRDLGLTFTRLLAAMAVDPHGYFEKKYVARIESATTENEINGVLTQLVQWASSSAVSDAERLRLDSELTAQGLPKVAELRLRFLP